MWYVYILRSKKTGKHYSGSSNNPTRRLGEHNSGKTRSLWKHVPLEIIRIEEYSSKIEAIRRERQIKSYKSGKAFKKLIGIVE